MRTLSILIAAGLALASNSFAQSTSGTATTDPVGYISITCSGSSDTFVSIPFSRPPEFVGTVQSISGNVLTVSGTPGWSTNQFVYSGSSQSKTYYALLASGTTSISKEGSVYTVTANDSQTLTLNLNGDDISSIPSGAQVILAPYWTLGTAFPASNAGVSFSASPSSRSIATQILIPNYSGTGINLAASAIYYFLNGAWRLSGSDPNVDKGNDVLPPYGYFIIRNPNNFPTTVFTATGNVPMKKNMIPLATLVASSQDNPASVTRPVDITLNSLGIIESGAFMVTTSSRSIKDQILVYNNSQIGINKSASSIYYYYNSGWRLSGGDPNVDYGSAVIPAGSGITIRKSASGTGQTVFWQNSPTY